MPTTLTHGIQLPDKGSVDWYSSMQSNYNLIDTHLGDTDVHVTAEDKANWNSKQGSLSQDQLDAIAQVATNTDDIATLQSGKANASHTHSSSDITDIDDYATKDYVDNSISGLVDNAPDALNTLNELSAALNDDSNFASTVTTALAAKANSADLATVATSGSYNDLDDKPTIPTNTSDLTNDSDFVDTSNSAVASGITSAKVIDYDTHIADTDIHVTTADKNRWNNNTYVFRYSSTALTASSTNSNTLLDNTDNLKVGDKVIDSSGVLFSITAIDTANSTFTIGTALIDLANDSDVVHKSGAETITGEKNFQNTSTDYSGIKLEGSRVCHITADNANDGVFTSNICSFSFLLPDGNKALHVGRWTSSNNRIFLDKSFPYMDLNGVILKSNTYVPTGETGTATLRLMAQLNFADDTNKSADVRLTQYDSTASTLYSNTDNVTSLGSTTKRWSKIYGTEYYYGSNNVEFSTKFVTTDTAQTISGAKTFSDTLTIYNNDSSQATKNLTISSSKIQVGDTSNSDSFGINFNAGLSYVARLTAFKDTSGTQNLQLGVRTKDSSNNLITSMIRLRLFATGNSSFESDTDNLVSLGSSSNKWSNVQTYKVNALEPSSLSLPSGDASNFIDISSYFTDTGSNTNSYTASANGWIFLRLGNLSGCQATVFDANSNRMWGQSVTGKVEQITIPILKGQTFTTEWATTSSVDVAIARFIPCQGNV